MKWPRILGGVVALLAVAAGCGPAITVTNATTIGLRVVVTAAGHSDVVSPTPHNSSTVEAEEGPYHVTVIADSDWVAHARATREFLDQQLASPDAMTGPQLLDLLQRLKDVAAAIHQYETAGIGTSCSGTITQDAGGAVTINTTADGKLIVYCQ